MLRRGLVLTAVVVATLLGGFAALAVVQTESTLSVGTVRMDVSPGHKGALDVYAPLVDWGVRFSGVRLPVRLNVDVRSVNHKGAMKWKGRMLYVAETLAGERVGLERIGEEELYGKDSIVPSGLE